MYKFYIFPNSPSRKIYFCYISTIRIFKIYKIRQRHLVSILSFYQLLTHVQTNASSKFYNISTIWRHLLLKLGHTFVWQNLIVIPINSTSFMWICDTVCILNTFKYSVFLFILLFDLLVFKASSEIYLISETFVTWME